MVRDDDESPFLGNVLLAFNDNLDSEQLEDDILEIETADVRDFVFASADTLIDDIGRSENDHPGEYGEVVKNSANESHKNL